MSILIDETTRVIVQGFTGDKATFHAREMIAYGTQVVGGVTPGKGGQTHLDRPVFNTVKDAVRATGAEASLAFVPPPFAADALMEAADAGLRLVCIITDGIPAQDMMRVKRYLRRYPKERRTTIVGPNCAGIISAGKAMLGIMPSNIYLRGSVGRRVALRDPGLRGRGADESARHRRHHQRRHRRRPDQRQLLPGSSDAVRAGSGDQGRDHDRRDRRPAGGGGGEVGQGKHEEARGRIRGRI